MQDLLEGLGGGVVEVHGVCSHENQDDGDTLLLGLGRSLKHLKKLYVSRFSEAEALTSNLNPPRQMLARIESKLEEYLTYLDEASWIQWKRRLIIRKKHLKEPEQSQFGNFASASSIPMGLQCAILTSALSCSSRLKSPAFVHEFWQKSTRRTQHPNINGLCMSILLMFTTIKVSEKLRFHGCLFLLSEYMPC